MPKKIMPGEVRKSRYITVLCPNHPRATCHGQVYQHVLVAEAALGHYMPEGGVVHHVNGITTDNRPSNLVILQNSSEHTALHHRLKVLRAGGNPWGSLAVPIRNKYAGVQTPLVDAEVVSDTSLPAVRAESLAEHTHQPTASEASEPTGLTAAQTAEVLTLAQNPPSEESDADRIFAIGKGNKGIKTRELSNFEAAHILDLYYRKHFTQCKVAEILHCHQSTVSRILEKYGDTTQLARRTLAAGAQKMAEKLVETAKPKEIIKTLRGIKTPAGDRVLEPEREYGAGQGGSAAPSVFVGVKVNCD